MVVVVVVAVVKATAVVAVASWAAVLALGCTRHSGWCGSELTLPMLLLIIFRAICGRHCGVFCCFYHCAAFVPFLSILLLVFGFYLPSLELT